MADRPPLAMQPEGIWARPFGHVMEFINRPTYLQVRDALAPLDGTRVLEIGFGTGAFLKLAHRAGAAHLAGVDPSSVMLARARARLAAGADLRAGTADCLDWPDASFDRVAAIHSFQFWSDPRASLLRIGQLLAPGGMLCLALRRHSGPGHPKLANPLSRSGDEVAATLSLLAEIGFDAMRLDKSRGASIMLRATLAPM